MQDINFSQVGSRAWEAVSYILYALVIYSAYYIGRNGLDNSSKDWGIETNDELTKEALLSRVAKGFTIILVISLLAGYYLGTTSNCSDADPVYGGCETTQEYTPTKTDRVERMAFIVVLLGAPYLYGALSKYRLITSGKAQEEYDHQMSRRKKLNDKSNESIEKMMAKDNSDNEADWVKESDQLWDERLKVINQRSRKEHKAKQKKEGK